MASGALTACKKVLRHPIRSSIFVMLAIAILVLIARLCAITGGPVSGRVIDADTGQPIADAIVIVRWNSQPPGMYSHPDCFHVETSRSTVDGTYRAPLWIEIPALLLIGQTHYSDAYRPGYERIHVHTKEAEAAPEDVYLKQFRGTDSERFDFISGPVFSGMSCLGGGTSQRSLFPLRKAALHEARNLARTDQQRKEIQGMLRITAYEWLATPNYGPDESDPVGTLPPAIRRELQ
jgi:hypothetical protein